MKIVKQSILAVLIMSCFMFFFYKAIARADNHCRAANDSYWDYRFCMGI